MNSPKPAENNHKLDWVLDQRIVDHFLMSQKGHLHDCMAGSILMVDQNLMQKVLIVEKV